MQNHINELDNNNALYSQENNKLRREVENLKQTESNLRSTKAAMDAEKQMRTTAEFDIQKMRIEIADLYSEKT